WWRTPALEKRRSDVMLIIAACLLLAGSLAFSQQSIAKTFATPEEARDELLKASAKGWDGINEFFGPGSTDLARTGDPVQDKLILEKFNQRVKEKTRLEPDQMNLNRVQMLIGKEEWPFAIPLVRNKGRWYFDLQEGKAEIRRRIIGGNE